MNGVHDVNRIKPFSKETEVVMLTFPVLKRKVNRKFKNQSKCIPIALAVIGQTKSQTMVNWVKTSQQNKTNKSYE